MAKEETKKEAAKRKTLEDLFHEPIAVVVENALMHQSFQVPNGSQQQTMSAGRPGLHELKMVYHPGYGLIGFHKGEYFLTPSANIVMVQERLPMKK